MSETGEKGRLLHCVRNDGRERVFFPVIASTVAYEIIFEAVSH
ncbi:hypothetical protein SCACP_30890 [Sporomusa carbonis]